jgi:hypothetical protein
LYSIGVHQRSSAANIRFSEAFESCPLALTELQPLSRDRKEAGKRTTPIKT